MEEEDICLYICLFPVGCFHGLDYFSCLPSLCVLFEIHRSFLVSMESFCDAPRISILVLKSEA